MFSIKNANVHWEQPESGCCFCREAGRSSRAAEWLSELGEADWAGRASSGLFGDQPCSGSDLASCAAFGAVQKPLDLPGLLCLTEESCAAPSTRRKSVGSRGSPWAPVICSDHESLLSGLWSPVAGRPWSLRCENISVKSGPDEIPWV